MKNDLVSLLIVFFSALLIYQLVNSVNILEGIDGATDNANSQTYKNVGDITTLQNQMKQNTEDIANLKSTVNTIVATQAGQPANKK